MAVKPFGLLIMAYGTPHSLDEVEAYYTDIRRGRPPSQEQLDNLVSRYQAIGGVSPLNEITLGEAHGVRDLVNQDGGRPCALYLGMKHTHPFIADAVQNIVADGLTDIVTLVLAPHYSTMSVAVYQKNAVEAAAACQTHPIRFAHVDNWHLHPRFLSVLASRVEEAMAQFTNPNDVLVVFTAHSLPKRIVEVGDPYPHQLQATGEAIRAQLGLPQVAFAWQSAGRTPEPWLGPDILQFLREVREQGQQNVIICPCGFVSDHLEVLYDIDIEAQTLAGELGIKLVRTRSLNADPEFLLGLAEVVRAAANRLDVANE